ncbi:hypothetical protein [Ensifer aridi]|nr:hypothetical protein [Ensifer aridi]
MQSRELGSSGLKISVLGLGSLEVSLSREVLDGIQSIHQRYGTTAP